MMMPRATTTILFLLTFATTMVAQGPATPAQTPPATATAATSTAPPAPVQPPSVPGSYVGMTSCANAGCHGATKPLHVGRVLQNEYYTWLNKDRHAAADNVLFSERSARIARNMHLSKKAYQEAACLDCHSTNVPAKLVTGHIDPEDGVQCEACHGPSSGWRAEHTQQGWTHEQSVARGMIDLRSVSTRGTLCLSCHIGNSKREVDHELIASGHPILAFELDNYSETMPAHWTPGNPTHGVPAFVTGQAMGLRESLANLARHARGDKWPEFSDMSCFNCHHALDTTWRQERGWPGRAGLPSWSPQHWAVMRLIVERVAPGSRGQLDDVIAQIATRVSHMNDPAGVAQAADEGVRMLDGLTPKIAAVNWKQDDIRAFMRTLASDDDFIIRSDVASAEQTALALQSLSAALTRANPKMLKSSMTEAIDALFTEVQNRNTYDPNRFVAKLRVVKGTL
jgi:hypothetical protein